MRRTLSLVAGLLVTLGGARVVLAQAESTAVRQFGGRGGALGQRGGRGGRGRNPEAARRQALTKQVREAFAGVVRRQLNLTDGQERQLNAVDTKYQRERTDLLRNERQTRLALAAALSDTIGEPDQGKISQYMDQLVQAQHRRADLLEGEQKELSGFLTPLQRARYQALRDQLQKRVAQLRQQQQADGQRGPPPPQP